MAIPESNNPKSQLRKTMRRIMRECPVDSKPIREALDRWLAARPGLRTIAVFSALPGEPDLSELVARHPDRRWVYPRVCGDDLVFHAVENPTSELISGAFNILEPKPHLAQIAISRIEAFLCPGLAFDAHGGRLGRGRGFYDRLLASAGPGALKIGVCFANQIVPDTFAESHDIQMDAVIAD